ncbi:hypothetical protein CR513_15397, partial [Mucuna pruriens]
MKKKENTKGKEGLYMSNKVVKKMLLAKTKPLYLLPTNMCFHLSAQLSDLPIASKDHVLRKFHMDYHLSKGYSTRLTLLWELPCRIELHIELTLRKERKFNKSGEVHGKMLGQGEQKLKCSDSDLDLKE